MMLRYDMTQKEKEMIVTVELLDTDLKRIGETLDPANIGFRAIMDYCRYYDIDVQRASSIFHRRGQLKYYWKNSTTGKTGWHG